MVDLHDPATYEAFQFLEKLDMADLISPASGGIAKVRAMIAAVRAGERRKVEAEIARLRAALAELRKLADAAVENDRIDSYARFALAVRSIAKGTLAGTTGQRTGTDEGISGSGPVDGK